MPKRCKARTRQGRHCPNAAGESGFCFTHDPARAAERSAARLLGGYNRRRVAASREPIEINAPADVLRLVNVVIADTQKLDNSPARSRALLAAAAAAISALQIGEMEERIRQIEQLLKVKGIKP